MKRSILVNGAAWVAMLAALIVVPSAASAATPDEGITVKLACSDIEERALTKESTDDEWRCDNYAGARSLAEAARIVVAGRTFNAPLSGTTVTSSAVVENGSELIDDISVATAGAGFAIRIGDGDAFGAAEAVAVINASHEPAESSLPDPYGTTPELHIAPFADYSIKCATIGQVLAYDGRWRSREYVWRYNPDGEPDAATTSRLVAATDTLATGTSQLCGNRPNRSELTYLGNIYWEAPQVLPGGGCGSQTSMNMVGFGPINNASTLAVACTWRSGGYIVKSDIKFDTSNRLWNTLNECSGNRYDLQAIATHEFGHALGLAHVFQESQQVMKPASSSCDLDQRELGYGDQRNLVVAYG